MPPDYSFTEVQGANGIIKEIEFMPSTLEVIDRALYKFAEEDLNIHVNSNKGWKKVPIIWVSAERAYQIKNDQNLRDSQGALKLPLITIERTSVEKDPSFKGGFQAHVPNSEGVRRITLPAAKVIKHDKTSNFQNAWSARQYGDPSNPQVGHGQINFPTDKANQSRVVIQTKYLPVPVYVKVMYSLKIRTEYVQQMNDVFQPFITRTGQMNSFFISHEGHRYEGFIEGSFGQTNNIAELGEDEKSYETNIELKILGYLMGEGPNDERPKVSIEENVVEVKMPRERVIVGDINTFLKKNDEGKGFYRE
jgi:hypothetical protein|tara:strand:+ start:894 stop:1814 length:921 start_codon:yes stop_codon:yes gene_type:complete